ncbi:unnamed protein product [Rotaria sordida]|uniref:Peptidase M60 domain-containing protein n=1 Tax=Rotaria sordida TaxID=392033 RepID=A0A815J9S9_9BILA|nr:unnamed protein product [Rotaria sordida]
MDDDDFDQVSQILFDGVDSLSYIGQPGTLIPITENTRAVLCSEDFNNVIIVATRFGQGRCLVFAHNSYTNIFLNDETEDQDFVENCRKWLARGYDAEFVSINDADSMDDVAQDDKILIWNGHDTKNDVFISDLCAYLEHGGALICGATAWGWLQINDDKLLSDFPFTRFCDYIGVKITDNYIDCPNPIPFQPELVAFKNVYHVVQNLVNDPNNIKYLTIVASAIKDVDDKLSCVPVETLQTIVMNANRDIIPSSKCPIQDASCREQSKGICSILCVLPGIKAPSVMDFPGDFDQLPRIETNIKCHIQSNFSDWFSTGYYVAAGIPIQIEVLNQVGATGWSARIGCHTDDLKDCDELRRWPYISVCKSLASKNVRLSSAFGGLLFLESPDGDMNSITVRLHHVILTPTYDLTDPNRTITWQSRRHHAQGLWADIAGRHIVFNVPSQSVLHLDSNQLDRVLQFWDAVVLAHHELRGTEPKHRERIVCDEQPSFGYMHSGYPIVTGMDVSDPHAEGFILNGNELEKNGAWGLFHEIGHNLQRDSWTYDGTMKSVFKRQICTTCLKLSEAFVCRGCHQPFCAKHVNRHQEKITKDMNSLVTKCDRLHDDTKSEKFAQQLLSNIDRWEKESIEKIRMAAQTARTDLRPWIERTKNELEIPFQKMMDELQSRRKLKDYTEIDLKRWNSQLAEFNEKLKQRPIIEYLDYGDPQAIHLIRIADGLSSNSSYGTNLTYSSSERSLNHFQDSPTLERETFGEIFGAITLTENDHVATYSGPWIGDASICGTNTYSTGVHNIRFRIMEKFYNAPFFGISTASQPMIEHMIKSSSTNGWSNFDFPVVNGQEEQEGKDRIVRSGDALTLTLDCDRRQIFLRHIRTNRLSQIPIDIRICPFPWKLLIVLRRRDDCVRLQGGSLGLTGADVASLLLPDHLKS